MKTFSLNIYARDKAKYPPTPHLPPSVAKLKQLCSMSQSAWDSPQWWRIYQGFFLKWIIPSLSSHVRAGTFHPQPLNMYKPSEQFISENIFEPLLCARHWLEPILTQRKQPPVAKGHKTSVPTAMAMTHVSSGTTKQRGKIVWSSGRGRSIWKTCL